MVALAIIALYVALAAWIWAMEGVQWVGKKTEAWDIAQNPVLGLLLPEKTLERVGPRWLSGFGIKPSTARREDQADFLLGRADEAIQRAQTLALRGDESAARSTIEAAGFPGRPLAPVSLDDLAGIRDAAKSEFKTLDDTKRRRDLALKLERAVAAARDQRRALAEDDEVSDADRDDLAAAVEEVMFSLEDYQAAVGDDDPAPAEAPDGATPEAAHALDPLRAIDALALQEAADAIRDAVPAHPSDPDNSNESEKPAAKSEHAPAALPFPKDQLDAISKALDETLDGIDARVAAGLDRVEPAVAKLYPEPTGFRGLLYDFRTLLGTDAQGRSIMIRSLYSAKIAIQVGVVVAIVSVLIGALLGAAAAYFGGWVDHAVTWLYSSLSSLPQLVLLAVLAFMFLGGPYERTLIPVYAALCLTFWIGSARVIRGEVLRVKQLEYVQAATAIGFPRPYILLKHIIPNTVHLMFINFSLLFIGAVKTEVILTFLGLGIKEGASWGLMISQAAPEVINGIFWQIGAATFFMLVLVLAFNVLSDALQDAFDPKHVG